MEKYNENQIQTVINNFKNKEDVKEFFRKKAKGE